jgi:hypothetical protein
MREGRSIGLVLAITLGAAGACDRAPAPGEKVSTTTLPPIETCYEPDGALCPLLDAGEDGGEDGGLGDAEAG